MVIHNFDFVAGYGETTASWFAFSGNAGNKYMQHFRGADAVEDFDSELPFPRVEDFSRQCFTGRNTLAHRRKIDAVVRAFRFAQDRGIKSRHCEENGWPVARHHLEYVRHAGALWIQQRARTGEEWKIHSVSQAVREKQFGNRKC